MHIEDQCALAVIAGLFKEPCSYPLCRITGINAVGLGIACQDAPNRQHRVAPHRDAWADNSMGPHPDTILDSYGFCDQSERGALVIVITCQQIGTLRDAYVAADLDLHQVVDPYAFTDPAVFPDCQAPRMFDIAPWLDDDATTDSCTEEPQYQPFESIKWK